MQAESAARDPELVYNLKDKYEKIIESDDEYNAYAVYHIVYYLGWWFPIEEFLFLRAWDIADYVNLQDKTFDTTKYSDKVADRIRNLP